MLKKILSIFSSSKIKELTKENQELKLKLSEKQEVINQTNSYWKKKIHSINKQKKAS
jgi:hypothetical protein